MLALLAPLLLASPLLTDKGSVTLTLKLLRQLPSLREREEEIQRNKNAQEFLNAILDFNHFIRFLAWVTCAENILSILFSSDYRTVLDTKVCLKLAYSLKTGLITGEHWKICKQNGRHEWLHLRHNCFSSTQEIMQKQSLFYWARKRLEKSLRQRY